MINSAKYFFVVSIFFFCAVIQNSYAQKFSASIERTTVGQNDRFQVDFTFEGGDVNSVSNFRQPNFAGFRVLSGPNQSSSMQIINGRASGSISLSYILQPSNVGEFTMGSASIDYAGKTYSTQPIKIKVEKGSPQQQQQSSSGGYNQQELAKSVFIVAEANKSRVIQGEQITITYKLYTKLNIASPQITKLPSYEGFWSEEIGPIKQINFDLEMYRGERFRVAKIKQVALFPSKTGTLNVTPFELNVPVIVKKKRTGNDMFDEFFDDSFFGRSETVQFLAKSNTLKVQVDPLPGGAPASFNGAVGNFTLKAQTFKINVRPGVGGEVASNNFAKEDVKLLSQDIRYIKLSDFNLEPKQEITFIKPWFWLSIVLPLLGMIGAFVYKTKQDKLYGNVQLLKFQKAEKEARKRLKLAKAALDSQQTTNFYSEISFALFGYLEDKLSIQKSEFTLDGAVEKLQRKTVNEALIARVKQIAERCEFARFAPQGEMQAAANDMYEETVKVIIDLDSSIGGKK